MNLKLFRQFISSLDDDGIKRVRREINREIMARKNKGALISKPDIESKSYDDNLAKLLAEDWSRLFDKYDDSIKNYYIYFHGDPSGPSGAYKSLSCQTFLKPLYVGLGQNNRAYNFKRNNVHSKELSMLEEKGFSRDMIAHVIKDGLTERQARELESKLILYFGIKASYQKKKSRRKGLLSTMPSCLLNSQYEPMPDEYVRYQG